MGNPGWKEPLEIEAAKPLELRYGVAVWDGEISPEKVETVYNKWKLMKQVLAKGGSNP